MTWRLSGKISSRSHVVIGAKMRSGSKSYIQRLSQTYMLSLEVLIQQRWLEPQLRPTSVEAPPPPVFSGTPLAATPPEASEASPAPPATTLAATLPLTASPASEAPPSPRECRSASPASIRWVPEIPAGPTCAERWERLGSPTGRDACVPGSRETAGIPEQRAASRERQHDDVWAIWLFRPRGWVLWVVLRETVE